ncbi:hypothetical protein BDV18DRAFT_162535 [Aspergillus unguis]
MPSTTDELGLLLGADGRASSSRVKQMAVNLLKSVQTELYRRRRLEEGDSLAECISSLFGALDRRDATIKAHKESLDQAKSGNKRLRNELNGAKTRVTNLEAEVASLEEIAKLLESEKADVSIHRDELQSYTKILEANCSKLENEKAALQQNLQQNTKEFRQRNMRLASERDTLQTERDSLNDRVTALVALENEHRQSQERSWLLQNAELAQADEIKTIIAQFNSLCDSIHKACVGCPLLGPTNIETAGRYIWGRNCHDVWLSEICVKGMEKKRAEGTINNLCPGKFDEPRRKLFSQLTEIYQRARILREVLSGSRLAVRVNTELICLPNESGFVPLLVVIPEYKPTSTLFGANWIALGKRSTDIQARRRTA